MTCPLNEDNAYSCSEKTIDLSYKESPDENVYLKETAVYVESGSSLELSHSLL